MKIEGFITKIIYNKPGFIILSINKKIKLKYTKQTDIIFAEQLYISAEGEFAEPDNYGQTFVANLIELKTPPSKNNKLSFFINGIGDITAKQIEEKLGSNYIQKLSDEPILVLDFYMKSSSLEIINQWKAIKNKVVNMDTSLIPQYISKNIKGIGLKKATEWIQSIPDLRNNLMNDEYTYNFFASQQAWIIYEQVKNLKNIISMISEIKKLGYSERMADLMFQNYKLEALNKLHSNPYIPVSFGMDFEECDEIAINTFNFDKQSMHRITNAVISVLKKNEDEGNTFMTLQNAINKTMDTIQLNDHQYINDIIKMNLLYEESEFILDNNNLYRRIIYFTERKISFMLKEKINQPKNEIPTDVIHFINNSNLSIRQKEAVIGLLSHNISILTGGPGTGKTRTISTLCSALDKMKKTYLLCAPTGRASKRMNESTGREAKTIYRTLEYKPMGLIGKFMKNENYPLYADYIIVDESSMLDVYIMNSLLKAIKPTTSLILVGDTNQLPSISMGSILKDLKESERIHVETLTEIFRQSESSLIAVNANNIMENKELIRMPKSDFSFIKISSREDMISVFDKIIEKEKDFQVLCPMKNSSYGTEAINQYLQTRLNKENRNNSVFINNRLFMVGDKVIQMSNDYYKEVYNGEIGTIESINGDTVKVNYPNNTPSIINYKLKEMKKIEHSYAITIHKSQGSEFDNVVLVVDGNEDFLTKELIYTGMTRAKKTLTILSLQELQFYKNLKISNNRATNLKNLIMFD